MLKKLFLAVIGVSVMLFLVLAFTAPTNTAATPFRIVSFTVDPIRVMRGEKVTLTWEVEGAESVNLMVDAQGVPVFIGTYPAVGSTEYEVNLVYNTSFYLVGVDAQGNLLARDPEWKRVTPIIIECPFTYFYGRGNSFDAPCPLDEVKEVEGVFQTFEKGMMIWREDEIYVLYDTLHFWVYRADERTTTIETPPLERFIPASIFSSVWAVGGIDYDPAARQGLGWATESEQTYTMKVQTAAHKNRYKSGFFMSLPDERVVYLDTSGRTWRTVFSGS